MTKPLVTSGVVAGSKCRTSDDREVIRFSIGIAENAAFFVESQRKGISFPVQIFRDEQIRSVMHVIRTELAARKLLDLSDTEMRIEFVEEADGSVSRKLALYSSRPAEFYGPASIEATSCHLSAMAEGQPVSMGISSLGTQFTGSLAPEGSDVLRVMADPIELGRSVETQEGAEAAQTAHANGPPLKDVFKTVTDVLQELRGENDVQLNLDVRSASRLSTEGRAAAGEFRAQYGGKKLPYPIAIEVGGEVCEELPSGVWPAVVDDKPELPVHKTYTVTCNGFRFNERVVYFNIVDESRTTGVKLEAYFEQGLHLRLIQECAGRPERILRVYIREESSKKSTLHVEKLEVLEVSEGPFDLARQ